MKKLIVAVLAVTMILASSIGVFAAQTEETLTERRGNMDAETFEELRMNQIEEALKEGKITSEQAEILKTHVLDVVEQGSFGNGPNNSECVLGEDGNLGIFRNENSGMKNGNGNGNRDGNRGQGKGQGTRRNGECILN